MLNPKHIGIIMDGNRRFSKRLMLNPWKGHEFGARKVEKVLNWAKELGIKELTLYAFSVENFNRPKEEYDFLMKLFNKEFDNILKDDELEKNKIKINFIGRINLFPKEIYEKMKQIMDRTKNFSKFIVNFAMAYGGRAEIIDATKKIANLVKEGKIDVNDIDETLFMNNLYLKSEPELVIRTSGEKRFSGFLLWQISYSELFFVDKLWPEFEKEDLISIVNEFKNRDRRFGR